MEMYKKIKAILNLSENSKLLFETKHVIILPFATEKYLQYQSVLSKTVSQKIIFIC